MKKVFFKKVFFSHLLVLGVLASLLMMFSFRTIRNSYIDSLFHELVKQNKAISLYVDGLIDLNDQQKVQNFAVEFGDSIDTRITIIESNGTVLADTRKSPFLMENHSLRPEVVQALQEEVGHSLRYSETAHKDMLYVANFISRTNGNSYIVRTSIFLEDINIVIAVLKRDLGLVALVVIMISIIIAYFFSKSFTTPINLLIKAFAKVSEGDFETRVFLKSNDELKVISDQFNDMTIKMRSLFEEISFQKEELQRIIATIKEGLLVLNSSGRILLTNDSLARLLNREVVEGLYYGEIITNPSFAALINRISSSNRFLQGKFVENNKVFLCDISYLDSQGQIVVVLHDVTEALQIEKMKKDFIINVSHELRTPLTAINGFVETLEDEVSEEHRRYLKIISRNSKRLIGIVNDLLVLAEIEDGNYKLRKENVNIHELLEGIERLLLPKAVKKGLVLKTEVDKDLKTIFVDSFKMEQVFINIIDNAIKYTERGSVNIALKQLADTVEIEITDTGIGIDEKHFTRIFERFYVVDKSRSRKVGGTGLGLSIVKHIVQLHDGTIWFKSSPKKGTTFTITIPQQSL